MKKLTAFFCIAMLLLCSCQKTTTYQVDFSKKFTYSGDEEKLESYLKELKREIRLYGEKNFEVAITYNNIGVTYIDLDEYEKSLDFLEKSITINEALGDERALASNYFNMGRAYFYMDDYETAIGYYEKSLAIDQELLGEGSFRAITVVLVMSDSYLQLGDYDKTLDLLYEIIEIDIKTNGEKSGSLPHAYKRVGTVYLIQKDYDSAINYFEEALRVNEQIEAPDLELEADVMNKFGDIYDEKEPEKATGYYKKAYDFYSLKTEFLKEQIILCQKLMRNYKYLGEIESAKEYGIKVCRLAEKYGTEAGSGSYDIIDYKQQLKEVYCQLTNDSDGTNFKDWYKENVLEEEK